MPASGLAFAPNDDVIVSAGSGLTVWDTSSLDEVISLANPGQRFNTVGFSPDGIYLAASDEKSVTLFTVKP
jgi:WD40 repeat protein